MMPARAPAATRDGVRMMVLDVGGGARPRDLPFTALPEVLRPLDLLVVNDAATIPASWWGRDETGSTIEFRLSHRAGPDRWWAVTFGAGDWRTRTEDRGAPPSLVPGSIVVFGELTAHVTAVDPKSPRWVELCFARSGPRLLRAFYEQGAPVQYSYLQEEEPLWSFQTTFASRAWAVEMPSAGRPLTWAMLDRLRVRGVQSTSVTHAAGLSSTGDPSLDARLPVPERYEVPERTVDAVARAKERGGRVIAVGTTVVRALEGAIREAGGVLGPGAGVTDLRIDADFEAQVVDGILTGMHEEAESHFELLRAFAPRAMLLDALEVARVAGYRAHEFGDTCLILTR